MAFSGNMRFLAEKGSSITFCSDFSEIGVNNKKVAQGIDRVILHNASALCNLQS
jgi:hypothetical protein